jgi:hypothetical protein
VHKGCDVSHTHKPPSSPQNPSVDEHAWNADWYVEKATNAQAMRALKDQPEGCFVIRDSSSQPGSFALSFRYAGESHHALIHGTPRGLQLAKSELKFPCLSDMIFHYSEQWTPACHELPCALNPKLCVNLKVKTSHTSSASMESDQSSAGGLGGFNTLSKIGDDGSVVNVNSHTGAQVPPPLPNRAHKPAPSESRDLELEDLNEDAEGALLQCPSCAKQQSVSNVKCSGCDESLSGRATPPKRVATKLYGRYVPKSAPSNGEDPGYVSMNKSPEPDDMASSSTHDETLDVKVERSTGVKSNLHATGAPPRLSKSHHIQFDDKNIEDTRNEAHFARGIIGRIDDEAYDRGFYLGDIMKSQANEKLRGAADGSFIVYDSTDDTDTLNLAFAQDGKTEHACIVHLPTGIQLDGSKMVFGTLSDLISAFATNNDERPYMLRLGDGSETLDRKKKTHKGPYNSFNDSPDYSKEVWYHADMSRAEAVAMIEFEPSGTFVVRDNHEQPGHFVLSYVKSGKLFHVDVKPCEGGVQLDGAQSTFTGVKELVSAYLESDQNGEIKCKLRPPKAQQEDLSLLQSADPDDSPAAPPVPAPIGEPPKRGASQRGGNPMRPAGNERPPWMQTNVPKAQALQLIADKGDGAFVIRSSTTREDCYVLSYKFRNQIHHELVMQHSGASPGFFLQVAPHKAFQTLTELVVYYEQPRPDLKYPLSQAPVYAATSGLTCSGSARSRGGDDAGGGGGGGPPPLSRGASQAKLNAPSSSMAGNTPPAMRHGQSKNHLMGNSQDGDGDGGGGGAPPPPLNRGQSRATVGRSAERLDQRSVLSNWCCMSLKREEALARLPQKEGAFIVRRSDDSFATLSLVANGKVHHIPVEDTTQGLHVKKSTVFQPNLSALIAYYKIHTQTDLPRALITW